MWAGIQGWWQVVLEQWWLLHPVGYTVRLRQLALESRWMVEYSIIAWLGVPSTFYAEQCLSLVSEQIVCRAMYNRGCWAMSKFGYWANWMFNFNCRAKCRPSNVLLWLPNRLDSEHFLVIVCWTMCNFSCQPNWMSNNVKLWRETEWNTRQCLTWVAQQIECWASSNLPNLSNFCCRATATFGFWAMCNCLVNCMLSNVYVRLTRRWDAEQYLNFGCQANWMISNA